MKTVFIHNKAIDYRIRLFRELSKTLNNEIIFVFYNQKKINLDELNCIFLHSKKIFGKLSFSFELLTYLTKSTNNIFILSGSHSYELIIAWIILKIRSKKIIFWTETWDWKNPNLKNIFFKSTIKFISKRADVLCYPGKRVKEFYQHIKTVPKFGIYAAPNASFTFSQNEIRSDSIVNVGFMGRPIPRKNLHNVINAFKYLDPKRYSLIIGGENNTEYYKYCKRLARNISNVKFYGKVRRSDVETFLNNIDILAYPSINQNGMSEPWGLAINEALSLNIPVITSMEVGAQPDLVFDKKNGVVLKHTDPESIANAIKVAEKINKKSIRKTNSTILEKHNYKNQALGFVKAINAISS